MPSEFLILKQQRDLWNIESWNVTYVSGIHVPENPEIEKANLIIY